MQERRFSILTLVPTWRARTLVVIHKVCTSSRVAGILWTIGNVGTPFHTIVRYEFFETTVALAMEVIPVNTSGCISIHTRAIHVTAIFVRDTVIIV